MKRNICACGYSGGKDGHLSLISAINRGLKVDSLIYIATKNKDHQPLLSNDTSKLDIIKKHAELIGVELFVSKTGVPGSESEVKALFCKAVKDARERVKFDILYWGSILPDKEYFYLKEVCRDMGVSVVFPLFGKTVVQEYPLLIKYGVRSVITGVFKPSVPAEWLGRDVDERFIDYVRASNKKSILYGDDLQTLVVESSLFDQKRVNILKHEILCDNDVNMDFLNILKWNVSGAHDSEVRSAARAKAGSSRMRVPKEIQKLKIAMTTDCVLACHHCKVDKKAAQCITFDDAAKAVDLLMSSPGKEKRLEFYGGEPFLKFQLLRSIVEYAKTSSILSGKQLSISVASNGLVLNEERLDFLKRNRINLSISVSGSEKAHDINRVYPGGKGSYADLMKKLGLVFNRMAAEDVVALECVQPSCASLLGRDLRRLAARGFKVMNIECVHGPVWGRDSLEDLENGLRSFAKWLFDEIRRGKYIALEPFLEFFRVKGAGGSIDCPLYRDLELYPDGVLSFYPFAFIDYPKWRKTVKIGSAASGLFKRYSSCAPGGKLCSDCVKEYYVIGGLSSGAQAYRLRTEMLKKIFLEIMRRSREEKAFKDYARWLAGLKQRTYIDYRGAK